MKSKKQLNAISRAYSKKVENEWNELKKEDQTVWEYLNEKYKYNVIRIKKFDEVQRLTTRIASYCYATTVTETQYGAWCVYFDEIASTFEISIELVRELKDVIDSKILGYEGVCDIEPADDCFDINMFTNYCVNDVE